MNKPKYVFGSIALVAAVFVVFSFVFVLSNDANAASTIGTNITTTGVFESSNTASAGYFLTSNTIQVGGGASVAYNRFGTSATGHSNYISASSDVIVSGDLEVRATASFGGVASISGVTYLANGQIRPGTDSATAFRFQNATGGTTILTIDTSLFRVGIGGTPGTTFEVQGTASASYFLTGNTIQVGGFASVAYNRFGTTATTHGHYIASSNDVLVVGDLEVRATVNFAGAASISNALWVGTNGKTGNVGIGTNSPATLLDVNSKFNVLSGGNIGVSKAAPTTTFDVSGSASVSTNFEVAGVASAATVIVKTSLLANSGRSASSSTAYIAEFGTADTGTVSLLFGGNSSGTKGTCFQVKDTAGDWKYVRVLASNNTFSITAVACHD